MPQTLRIIFNNDGNAVIVFSGFTGYSGAVCTEAAQPIIDALGKEKPRDLTFGEKAEANHHTRKGKS